jgi:hypothetical protein
MLEDKPPSEFIKLLVWKRQEIFRRYMVKEDDYVQIEEGDDDDFLTRKSQKVLCCNRNISWEMMRLGNSL